MAIAFLAKNQKGSDRSHRDVDEDDRQRPNVNNQLHRWRDVPSSVVRTFRIDRSQNSVAPPVAVPTDYLNRAAAAEAAVQAVQQAVEGTAVAAKPGQPIPVVLPAPANQQASAIEPVEHRREGREVTLLAIERRPVAQLAVDQPADAQPADAPPANQAVRVHAHRVLVENEVVNHQVHRKANEAAKDDGRKRRQLDR